MSSDAPKPPDNKPPQSQPDPAAELAVILENARVVAATLTQIASTADATVKTVNENHLAVCGILEDVRTKQKDIGDIANHAISSKSQIDNASAQVLATSGHIESVKSRAEEIRGGLEAALTDATQKAAAAEALRARTEAANSAVVADAANVQTARITAESDAAVVATKLEEAQQATEQTKNLAAKAEAVKGALGAYEKRLGELEKQSAAQLSEITRLLPGATSAGLASAFDDRRKTFRTPTGRWQSIFVGSVIVLVLIASTSLWRVLTTDTNLTYDDLVRLLLTRIPVALPLIWLAMHASREAALGKRLEEDYGYKAAVASSFQGFHQQMTELAEKATGKDSPLSILCTDTLAIIASPPGRIYEKHKLTVTPSDEAIEILRTAFDGIKKVATKTPPPAT